MSTNSTTPERASATPGPWDDVRPNRKEFGVYRIAAVAAHLQSLFDSGSSDGVEAVAAVDEANARVIAAAPDLLQALQEVVGAHAEAANCFYCEADTGTPHEPDCTMHFVVAAIAKAEGGAR
jgi:hypothetical protein